MFPAFEKDQIPTCIDASFLNRLTQIYGAMDRTYHRAADHYGFACDGCRDNCCRTRFYHHTIIERAYLIHGLKTLNPDKQNEVKLRALKVVNNATRENQFALDGRPMCPLNFNERCILYPYRPMICRLHGLPHELQKPGRKPVYGPGCETFHHRCGRQDYFKLDRTPFYHDMALLEQEVRQSLGVAGKIRMNVAEMILTAA